MMDPVQDTSADGGTSPGRGRQHLVARLVLAGIVVLVLLVGGDDAPSQVRWDIRAHPQPVRGEPS